MENNDLGFIKFDLKTFKEIYEKRELDINENLIKKASELISNYNCFISNYDAKSLWEKKKMMAQKKNKPNIRNKPRVILIDFSDEMKCKKEFTSYLNKLTDVNKETIYNKIYNFIRELNDEVKNSLFDVLINFIKVSSNNIYIDVLYLFEEKFIKENISNYLKNFKEKKEWIPEEIIIENKILYDNNNYDKYCLYVKLKKNSLSILKALLIILNRMENIMEIEELSNEIFNDIHKYLQTDMNIYKHIIELLLDELILILDYHKNLNIIEKLRKINLNDYEYSTKFKIMKILDLYK
jgi:hypothetical protein